MNKAVFPAMGKRTLMGMLTPSSNTVLEPVCAELLRNQASMSVHFSRFPVTRISTSDQALGQFATEPMLNAAALLADAKVDVICWNGTSAGWLGFNRDVKLCEAIEARTGIKATSAVLAMIDAFKLFGARKIGLVTPYIDGIQSMINENFGQEGFPVVSDQHLGVSENFAFSLVGEDKLAEMTRQVAAKGPDAIVIFCTNLNGARVAATLEPELGIPIFDSISLAIWGCLRVVGADTRPLAEWGRMFSQQIEGAAVA